MYIFDDVVKEYPEIMDYIIDLLCEDIFKKYS